MNRYPGNSSPWTNSGQFRPQLQGGPNYPGGRSPIGPRFPYFNTQGGGHENSFANGSPRPQFYPSPRQGTPYQYNHNQNFSGSGGPYGSGPRSENDGFRPNASFVSDGGFGAMSSTPSRCSPFGNDSTGRGGRGRKRPSPSDEDGHNKNKSFRSNNSSFADDIAQYYHPAMLQDPWARLQLTANTLGATGGSQRIST